MLKDISNVKSLNICHQHYHQVHQYVKTLAQLVNVFLCFNNWFIYNFFLFHFGSNTVISKRSSAWSLCGTYHWQAIFRYCIWIMLMITWIMLCGEHVSVCRPFTWHARATVVYSLGSWEGWTNTCVLICVDYLLKPSLGALYLVFYTRASKRHHTRGKCATCCWLPASTMPYIPLLAWGELLDNHPHTIQRVIVTQKTDRSCICQDECLQNQKCQECQVWEWHSVSANECHKKHLGFRKL